MNEQDLIDIVVEHGEVPGIYFSAWSELGRWQMDTLKELGLRPEDTLLDIGCGSMRLGCRAVEYLDDGNYCGLDAYPPYIAIGHALARRQGLTKRYDIRLNTDFDFASFGHSFAWANAQSVFTHLTEAQIETCMARLAAVMQPGGRFLFTFCIESGPAKGMLYGGTHPMIRCSYADPGAYQDLGRRHGARMELLSISHPTGQLVGLYHF
ncbi:SAM-dependent methyltransferase [Azospirillum sp. sgz302134]